MMSEKLSADALPIWNKHGFIAQNGVVTIPVSAFNDIIESALSLSKAREERLREALKPFADCADELDGSQDVPRAPDGEWAKFRLLTDDYRLARQALKDTTT